MKLDILHANFNALIQNSYNKQVFYSNIDRLNVDICYDPKQSYLFKIYLSGYCNYKITLDRKVINIEEIRDNNILFISITACKVSCRKKQ